MIRAAAALLCHPAAPDRWLAGIDARILIDGDRIHFRYTLHGRIDRLRIPARPTAAVPGASDELWRHTCCEAFVAAAGEAAYREFNFAPSGHWAHYAFTAPRQRDGNFRPPAAPHIDCRHHGDSLVLDAAIERTSLPPGDRLEFALTTVVEADDGNLSYWALEHPAALADFHRRDAFVLNLDLRSGVCP